MEQRKWNLLKFLFVNCPSHSGALPVDCQGERPGKLSLRAFDREHFSECLLVFSLVHQSYASDDRLATAGKESMSAP